MQPITDTKIDVSFDSVTSIMQKLMMKAYGGKPPEGGIDMPSNVAIQRVPEVAADYTIEELEMDTNKTLSYDAHLVPPVSKPEPIAKQSQSPFSSPFQDTAPVGLFGKALQSHSKLVSALKAVNVDTDNLVQNFKDLWAIDDDVDLDVFYSRPRSKGAAMYGGLRRNTVPATLAVSSGQTKVAVIDRGTARREISDRALIDWPRMKTIAMATGLQLIVDDEEYRKDPKPIHFKISRRDIPLAPEIIVAPKFQRIPREKVAMTRQTIVMLSAKMRKLAVLHREKFDNLEIEELTANDVLRAIRAVPKGIIVAPDARVFDNIVDFDYAAVGHHEVKMEHADFEEYKKIRPIDVIQSFSLAHAEQNKGNVPRAREVRRRIVALDEEMHKSRNWLEDLIRRVYPKDILLRVYYFGNIIGKKSGLEWVNNVRKLLQFPHSGFSERDLVRNWEDGINNVGVLKSIAEETAVGFTRYETLAINTPKITKDIQKELAHAETFGIGLSKLIKRHAIYWHNRYANKIRDGVGDEIKNQMMAKVFRKIKLKMTSDMEIYVENKAIAEAFYESAVSFVRKRRPEIYAHRQVPIIEYSGDDITDYGKALDKCIKRLTGNMPKVTFASLSERAEEETDMFLEDMEMMIDKILSYEHPGVPDTYLTDRFENIDDVAIKEKRVAILEPEEDDERISKVVPVLDTAKTPGTNPVIMKDSNLSTVPKTVAISFSDSDSDAETKEDKKTKGVMILDDDSSDEEDKEDKLKVNLREELEDAGVETGKGIAKIILQKYPDMVHYKEVDRIRNEILSAHSSTKTNQNF